MFYQLFPPQLTIIIYFALLFTTCLYFILIFKRLQVFIKQFLKKYLVSIYPVIKPTTSIGSLAIFKKLDKKSASTF